MLNIGNERMEHHDGIMGNERNNDGQNDDVVDDGIPKDFTSPNVRVNAGKTGKWRYSTTSKGTQNQNSRPVPIRGNKASVRVSKWQSSTTGYLYLACPLIQLPMI
ncbi:hypothetical protein HHI36_022745 [Cryptolaemus montrouzieri]|uniref:Uncharacterized protein n=1 Tax=Cryptolaemus montrouzieri TaxID=559131 RepID=A0ABD2N0T9_9CUCU